MMKPGAFWNWTWKSVGGAVASSDGVHFIFFRSVQIFKLSPCLCLFFKKKIQPGVKQHQTLCLRIRPYHANQEKTPNLTSPIHSGTAPWMKLGSQMRGFFFLRTDKLASSSQQIQGSNSDRQGAKRTTRPTDLAFGCPVCVSVQIVGIYKNNLFLGANKGYTEVV